MTAFLKYLILITVAGAVQGPSARPHSGNAPAQSSATIPTRPQGGVTSVHIIAGQMPADSSRTFINPILRSGADPWVISKGGYYYYTNTEGNHLSIWKVKNMARLATAQKKVIWTPDSGQAWSKEIWAPELHFLEGKWYMYFAADDGQNRNHRIYVLENTSSDPMQGNWTFKGKLTAKNDKWAIDASVFSNNRQLYLIWSGWQGVKNGCQNIYIARLKNPYTVKGPRTKLSTPQYPWEEHGNLNTADNPSHVKVNEGPEILIHGDKIFLIYSASGCWTDDYKLGMLTASINGNLMNARSWKKSRRPVFTGSKARGVYAPGHNSFFKSPDGTQDWILYHANPGPGCGCDGKRSPRIQQFSWKADGTPNFGSPVSTGTELQIPSDKHYLPVQINR